jgi:hypothetical protein
LTSPFLGPDFFISPRLYISLDLHEPENSYPYISSIQVILLSYRHNGPIALGKPGRNHWIPKVWRVGFLSKRPPQREKWFPSFGRSCRARFLIRMRPPGGPMCLNELRFSSLEVDFHSTSNLTSPFACGRYRFQRRIHMALFR